MAEKDCTLTALSVHFSHTVQYIYKVVPNFLIEVSWIFGGSSDLLKMSWSGGVLLFPLLEKIRRISLYVTDDAITKLYVT